MAGEPLTFTLRVDHNPYLAEGQRRLQAIVQVTATEPDPAGAGGPPVAAEVIIIDTSKSMTGSRITEACRAACAAVDVVRDGTYFAVIAGHTSADPVYPADRAMVAATPAHRELAKREIAKVAAGGTTNMSAWLGLADTLLTRCPAQIKHAVMLTDGKSMDRAGALRDVLTACEGHFVCDCRGVGEDWRPEELSQIAQALLGTWKPVAAAAELADDFRAALTASMAKRIPHILLRVRLIGETAVTHFAQVWPSKADLTGKGVVADGGQAIEFPLGHWGAQLRDYDLRLRTSQRTLRIETGALARAAWVDVLLPSPPGQRGDAARRVAATVPVAVGWTSDVTLFGPIDPRVAGYTEQEELAATVRAGLAAWRHGQPDAREKIGRAVQLAHQARHDDLLERFSAIAELVDPAEGIVRLRGYDRVSRAEEIWATYISEQSQLVVPEDEAGEPDAEPDGQPRDSQPPDSQPPDGQPPDDGPANGGPDAGGQRQRGNG